MIRNYLLLAVKHFRRQKMFSLINILGLTLGITCCILIFLYVLNEFSYDSFHQNGKNIYRVERVSHNRGETVNIAWLSPPYSIALKHDYPADIVRAVRVQPDNDLISYKGISFNEKNIFLADSDFFELFSFRLLRGDPRTVLADPQSIVMTQSTAKKYFGTQDPIGQIVMMNQKIPLKVTGIAEDVPVNSHLQFDMVAAIHYYQKEWWFNQWPNNGLYVYLELNPASDPAKLALHFPQFMDKYMGEFYRKSGFKMDLKIEPFRDIYFGEASFSDQAKHGSRKTVGIFMSIALFILAIACINFMNLSTARATDRSKEVGLRKVLGAVRRQLVGQFILESFVFAGVAAVLALALVQLLLPAYFRLLGYSLPVFWTNPLVYAFVAAVVIVVGLMAGAYPALLLSGFSPIESLKGKLRKGKGGTFFRQALVVFQFGLSVVLIVSILVMASQMHFIKTTDLGFSREASVIIRLDNEEILQKRDLLKSRIQSIPGVYSVSLMSGEPGGFHDGHTFESQSHPGEPDLVSTEYADFDFAKTLGLKFIAGRDFSAAYPSDSAHSVIINRKAAALWGYTPEQAIGKWVRNIGRDSTSRRTIVGVVEDYHFTSLREPIRPLVISTNQDQRLALIRLSTSQLGGAVDKIKKAYHEAAADYPAEIFFLDQQLERLYKAETNQESAFMIFSILAIVIAGLGLFGLASYTAQKRTKEIGVRKVLGSSVTNIILLISRELLRPVLLGSLIALPLTYYLMNRWLQGFTYRVHMQWWMYAGAAVVALTIALCTVSTQAIKAAMASPVKSLKTE